ncbi:MAG: trypsin-like peptidase domain-containing protein [Rubrivivax sp.]
MIEPILLTTARVSTFHASALLTVASGFFFERDEKMYLVTSRHVLVDPFSAHRPDRIEVEMHVAADNLTEAVAFSVPLYVNGQASWHQGRDGSGEIDVAVIELDRAAMPDTVVLQAFTPQHLTTSYDAVEVGTSLLVIGFPLGFHDTLHHLPVARRAAIASSFGLRFQGQGFFLTDGRTHRGTSGAPVVMRSPDAPGDVKWTLLGVHSSRMDMATRDLNQDESLGLNCAWYADILMTLTDPASPAEDNPAQAVASQTQGSAAAKAR